MRLPRKHSITRRADFARVKDTGQSKAGRFVVLGTLADPALDGIRTGFITTKRCGKAHDRVLLRRRFRALVQAHAQYLKQNGKARVILQGNADERGSREYNLALGQKRSDSVKKALEVLGIPDAQIESVRILVDRQIPLAQHPYLQVGKYIRVLSGPFTGAVGIIKQVKGHRRLVVQLDLLRRAVACEIAAADVIPVDTPY